MRDKNLPLDAAVTDMIAERLIRKGVIAADRRASFPDMNVFCPLPWMRASVTPTGKVVPCCYAEGDGFSDLHDTPLSEAWNAPAFRSMRLNMLRGRASPECVLCYAREKEGLRSHRQVAIDAHAQRMPAIANTGSDGGLASFEPVFLEIRFSNVCNLKCRTCGPHYSSSWYEDARKLGVEGLGAKVVSVSDDRAGLLAQIEDMLPRLTQIRFAGGEPLLMDEHYALLDLLIRNKRTDVVLSYHTNLSVLTHRGRDVTKDWARFRNVLVRASLDASGARGEYMRKGLDWNDAVRNRVRLRDACPNVRFLLFPTVSVFNILAVLEMHREWLRLGYIRADEIQLNALTWPAHYSVQVMPKSFKSIVRERYEAYIDGELSPLGESGRRAAEEFRAVADFMEAKDASGLLPEFRSLTARLDAHRGEDFVGVFPELSELLK